MKIEDLAPIAILFLVTGIVLGIGADVLTGISDNVVEYNATIARDSDVTLNTTTSWILTSRAEKNGNYGSLVVRNITGNVLVHAGNYTFDTSAGTVILTANTFNESSFNLTYTFDKLKGVPVAAVDNATAGVGEMASWMPTLALVLAAALIIGMVVGYFRTKRD